MIVSGKYELLELLSEGEVQTYRARHRTLGQLLMVHLIKKSAKEKDHLLDQLSSLSDIDKDLFIDVGEEADQTYVVSRVLQDLESLPSWLNRRLKSVAPSGPPKLPGGESEEFLEAFRAGPDNSPKTQKDPSEFSVWFDSARKAASEQKARREKPPVQKTSTDPLPKFEPLPAIHTDTETVVTPPIKPTAPLTPSTPLPAASVTEDILDRPEKRPAPSIGRKAAPPLDFALEPLNAPDRTIDSFDSLAQPPLPAGRQDDWPALPPPARDSSYTMVVSDSRKLGSSTPTAPKPAAPPATPKGAAVPEQTQPPARETWYWVSLAVLAVFAIVIVLFFSLKS
jgi:hypothetical protein